MSQFSWFWSVIIFFSLPAGLRWTIFRNSFIWPGQSGFISNYVCLVADVNLGDDCEDDTETSVDREEPTHLYDDNNVILTILVTSWISQTQVTVTLAAEMFWWFKNKLRINNQKKLLTLQVFSNQILTVLFPNIWSFDDVQF